MPAEHDALVAEEQQGVEAIYEGIFNHKAFTGRSGTFFGYEGLGSIYWHMVSKLRLAAFEVTQDAVAQQESSEVVGRLFDHYFEINAGIGAHKSPELYGAFPTDPYSHTPGGKRRPAARHDRTGQGGPALPLWRIGRSRVGGQLHFDRALMHAEEFLSAPASFEYVDVQGPGRRSTCPQPGLHPVPSARGAPPRGQPSIEVTLADGRTERVDGLEFDLEWSQKIFRRTHEVARLTVTA